MVRKESAGNVRDPGSDPWVGKIPWRRALQPSPVFSRGQRNLACCSPWDSRVGQDWVTNASWLAGSCRDKSVSCIYVLVGGSEVKPLPAMQETRVWSLVSGRSPGKGGGSPLQDSGLENCMLQCTGSQRVGRDWAASIFSFCVARLPGCLSRRAVHRLASWLALASRTLRPLRLPAHSAVSSGRFGLGG